MRRLWVTLAAAFIALVLGSTISSNPFTAQAAEAAASGSLIAAIVADAQARGDLEKDRTTRAWLSEIEGFYRVAGTKPLWVNRMDFQTMVWRSPMKSRRPICMAWTNPSLCCLT